MGWYYEPSSRSDLIESLVKTRSSGTKCLRHCYRGNMFAGNLWSVWQQPDGKRYIHCDVMNYRSDMWGYQPMSEDCGPFRYSCPLSYLELADRKVSEDDLSDENNVPYWVEWRGNVVAHALNKAATESTRKSLRERFAMYIKPRVGNSFTEGNA